MIDEFNTFLEYCSTVKNSIISVTHDDNMAEDEKVQVLYGTPPAAFAKYKEKIINGEKNGPLITFYMSGCRLKENEQIGGYKVLNVERDNGIYEFRAPLVFELKYTITINCIKESQADLLSAQILMAMPFNRPYWSKLNGQWVTMIAGDQENLSSVDIGENKDKISRRQLTITIDRAYLEHPFNFRDKPTNKRIEVFLNSEEAK